MEIYRVIYNTNTGEIQSFKKLDTITVNLNAQSQNLALDYEKPGLVSLNWQMMILFGALGGLGGIIIKIFWRKIIRFLAWMFGWKKKQYEDLVEV